MLIYSDYSGSKYQLKQNIVQKSTSMNHIELHVKLLGVHIDQQLSFNYHITEMCKKASYQTKALARLSGMLNVESIFLIFNAYVVSNFM